MRDAVIVASSRTPLAKSFRGSFNLTRPDDLAAHCIRDVLRKTPQLDPAEIEDVILGCGQPHGVQGHNIARVSAMVAGLPTSVPGTTVNRFCASGLQSIAMAAHQVQNEGVDAIDRRRRRKHHHDAARQLAAPRVEGTPSGAVHGDGRNRRGGRETIRHLAKRRTNTRSARSSASRVRSATASSTERLRRFV